MACLSRRMVGPAAPLATTTRVGRLHDPDVGGPHGAHGTDHVGHVLVVEDRQPGHAALDQLLGDQVGLLQAELGAAAGGVVDLGDEHRVLRRTPVDRLARQRPQRRQLGAALDRLGVGLLRVLVIASARREREAQRERRDARRGVEWTVGAIRGRPWNVWACRQHDKAGPAFFAGPARVEAYFTLVRSSRRRRRRGSGR